VAINKLFHNFIEIFDMAFDVHMEKAGCGSLMVMKVNAEDRECIQIIDGVPMIADARFMGRLEYVGEAKASGSEETGDWSFTAKV